MGFMNEALLKGAEETPKSIPNFPDQRIIGIEDRLEVLSYLERMPVIPSDVTFQNLFSYDERFLVSLSRLNGNIVASMQTEEEGLILFPVIGNNIVPETMFKCLDHFVTKEGRDRERVTFMYVPKDIAETLAKTSSKVSIKEDKPNHDYIYNANSLIPFEGAVGQKKRRYFRDRNPTYHQITAADIDKVSEFSRQWFFDKKNANPQDFKGHLAREEAEIKKVLQYREQLMIKAGYMCDSSGEIAGLAIAEIIGYTAFIHNKKAKRETGCPHAILHLFGTNELLSLGVRIINLEQAMGDKGLKDYKEQLHPLKPLLEKYTVRLNS
jgi:hypothetical protein